MNSEKNVKSIPSISVVVPIHKSTLPIKKVLYAITKSNIKPLEVIVADQTIDDEVKKQCEEFDKLNIKLNKVVSSNSASYTRNQGAKHAKGDLLLFIDSDIEILADTIEKLIEPIDYSKNIVAVFGRYSAYTPVRNFASVYKNLYHSYIHKSSRGFVKSFWTACGIVDRKIFLDIGGFDEKYTHCGIEDVEFGWRLSKNDCKIYLNDEAKVIHLKERTFWGTVWFDVNYTAKRWTKLIIFNSALTKQLNTTPSAFISLLLSYVFFGSIILNIFLSNSLIWLCVLCSIFIVFILNRNFFKYVYRYEGKWLLIKSLPMFVFFNIYAGIGLFQGILSAIINRKI